MTPNVGTKTTFSEYHSQNESKEVKSGSYKGIDYCILKIPHVREKDGTIIWSHYAGYIDISSIDSEYSTLNLNQLPTCPGHGNINFGPTTDGWIGFGTIDSRDFNYTEDMDPLRGDHRIDSTDFIKYFVLNHYTPTILQSSLFGWINQINTYYD